jgi:FkbM family methyltransferase
MKTDGFLDALTGRIYKLRRMFRFKDSLLKEDSFLTQVKGVIHIGGNSGAERETYASLGLNVIWVEPLPDVFEMLRSNISHLVNQRACQYLLAAEHGIEYTFHVADNGGASSSIFDFAEHSKLWPDVSYCGDIQLTSTTLTRLIDIERVDLDRYGALVLDTQGSELLILKGALPVLKRFKFVKTEAANFESYAGCCQLDELTDFMHAQGFKLIEKMPFAFRRGVGTYFDVLYRLR